MKRLYQKLPLGLIIYIIISIVISLLAIYRWFIGGTILYYWDANVPFDTKISFQTFFYPWYSNKFPGFSGNGWSWLPYWAVLSGFKILFQSLSHAQFALYTFLLTTSIVGFFVLIRHIRTLIFNKNNSIVASYILPGIISLCYVFNLYTFYYAYYMFNPQMFTIAFLPWNVLAIVRLFPLELTTDIVVKKSGLWILLYFVTQVLMIPGFTTYVFLVQYFGFVGLYFILYWLFTKKNSRGWEIISFLLLIFTTGLLHWTWFYPSLLGFKELYESQASFGVLEYLQPGSINTNLLNLFRLIGSAMMNNNVFSWDWVYTSQSILALPLFIFPFSILFLIWKLKDLNKRLFIIFFSVVLLGSLFIMKLLNPPFSWITKLFFEYVPFFGAFRDSVQKAGLYFLLSYFLLITLGLEVLWSSLKRTRYLLLGISAVFFAGVVLITGPYFLFSYDNIKKITFYYMNNLHTLSAKTIIPNEYLELKKQLEPLCAGTVTMVVPRTSAISSAVWPKYGFSYVGQDYLSNSIDCNFISTHLIHNKPDSFITAPYLMLQDGNFLDFKKYLQQNSISIILVRKDYVPYYFTHWAQVNPEMILTFLSTDNDFSKKFENDFFVLYTLRKNNEGTPIYGFSLTSTMVYTNASLTSAGDFKILSSMIPNQQSPVVIYRNDQWRRYQNSVNMFIAKSNCVGCVKISQQFRKNANDRLNILTKIKSYVKPILKKRDKTKETEEVQLSLDLIDMNTTFFSLMDVVDKADIRQIQTTINTYTNQLQKYQKRMGTYQPGFFEKNNKLIETRNFISNQNNQLFLYMRNTDIPNQDIYRQLNLLLSFQNTFLTSVAEKIWETNEHLHQYNMRLDIPSSGLYDCRLDLQRGFTAKSLSTGFEEQPVKINKQSFSFAHTFEQGSYPLALQYSSEVYKAIELSNTGAGAMKQFDLGILQNGAYGIQMVTQSEIHNPLGIVVTTGQLDLVALSKLSAREVVRDDIQLFDIYPTQMQDAGEPYAREFVVDALESKKYFVYVFPINTADQERAYHIINITIQRALKEKDVEMGCILDLLKNSPRSDYLNVQQTGRISYSIRIPENSSAKYLVFNQSYDPDWQAFVVENGKRTYLDHIQSGYANAWVLPQNTQNTVYVEFNRLVGIYINAFVSLSLGIAGLIFFVVLYRKTYA